MATADGIVRNKLLAHLQVLDGHCIWAIQDMTEGLFSHRVLTSIQPDIDSSMEPASVATSMYSAVGNTGTAIQSHEEKDMPEVPCTAVMCVKLCSPSHCTSPGRTWLHRLCIQAWFSLIGYAARLHCLFAESLPCLHPRLLRSTCAHILTAQYAGLNNIRIKQKSLHVLNHAWLAPSTLYPH